MGGVLPVLALALTAPWAPLAPLSPARAQAVSGQLPAGADPTVRVLLAESRVLELTALRRPLQLTPANLVVLPGQTVRLRRQGEALVWEDERGARTLPRAADYWLQALQLRPVLAAAPQGEVDAAAATELEAEADFQLQKRRYRGRLQLLLGATGLQAVNHLPLESYLPSVVGSEMPASWPQAALRAQAVAARTYVLRQRKPTAPFDVSATTASQVYKGVEAETPSTRQAVDSTRGQVLLYGGRLANAVFHSSGGGVTENSGDIWSQQLPYLVSVPDFDTSSPVSQWQLRLEPFQLRKAFGEIGGVTRIDVLATTASGRVRQARVVGPSGTLVLTGPQLRSRLGLRSTLVRFEVLAPEVAFAASAPTRAASPPVQAPVDAASGWAGHSPLPPPPPLPSPNLEPLQVPLPALLAIGRGFGHGVGMSQWGAYAMAQQGRDYGQILNHYYRGAEVQRFGMRAAP